LFALKSARQLTWYGIQDSWQNFLPLISQSSSLEIINAGVPQGSILELKYSEAVNISILYVNDVAPMNFIKSREDRRHAAY
jgi:hypothetical protein